MDESRKQAGSSTVRKIMHVGAKARTFRVSSLWLRLSGFADCLRGLSRGHRSPSVLSQRATSCVRQAHHPTPASAATLSQLTQNILAFIRDFLWGGGGARWTGSSRTLPGWGQDGISGRDTVSATSAGRKTRDANNAKTLLYTAAARTWQDIARFPPIIRTLREHEVPYRPSLLVPYAARRCGATLQIAPASHIPQIPRCVIRRCVLRSDVLDTGRGRSARALLGSTYLILSYL